MLPLFLNNVNLLVNILLSHRDKKIVFKFILQENEFCDENKYIYLNLDTKYQDYRMVTFYFLKMYAGVYLYKLFVGKSSYQFGYP